ncbi:GNAT family N-acetyltransferase [Scatolibacter rhodanostii]|uniref:GNAT family N-acetyltransferase n=1 Tax=Scatolibacter rhodanostii TaxID=2014781 RepID=UPI0013565720|nr:GNAT family protein [Scatolibacter rhodanostii]
MILETNRLLLRPFQQKDLQDFYDYAKHPDVGPHAGWKPHENLADSQEILNIFMTSTTDTIFAIVLKENNKVIGSVGIHPDNHRPKIPSCKMLGYVLSADYWGQGIMTEAARAVIDHLFSDKSFALVSCAHFPFNQRSKRVIEKCGFVYEGCFRHAYPLHNGEIVDECCYSMTREDYLHAKV